MPYIARHLIAPFCHTATSLSVFGMQMGLPVVPDEQWKRTISSIGAPLRPIGYSSLRSVFFENGRSLMSASVFMCSGFVPSSSQRLRKRGTLSYAYFTVHCRRWSWSSRSCGTGRKSIAETGCVGEFTSCARTGYRELSGSIIFLSVWRLSPRRAFPSRAECQW